MVTIREIIASVMHVFLGNAVDARKGGRDGITDKERSIKKGVNPSHTRDQLKNTALSVNPSRFTSVVHCILEL